jgi:hypothetical protein
MRRDLFERARWLRQWRPCTLALGVGSQHGDFQRGERGDVRPPRHFSNPDEPGRLWESDPEHGRPTFSLSHPNSALAGRGAQLPGHGGHDQRDLHADDGGGMRRVVRGLNVTATFLTTLEVTPLLGRNFFFRGKRNSARQWQTPRVAYPEYVRLLAATPSAPRQCPDTSLAAPIHAANSASPHTVGIGHSSTAFIPVGHSNSRTSCVAKLALEIPGASLRRYHSAGPSNGPRTHDSHGTVPPLQRVSSIQAD